MKKRQKRGRKNKRSKLNAVILFLAVCIFFFINILMAGNKDKNTPSPGKIAVPEGISVLEASYPEELAELLERNPETREFVEGYENRHNITDKSLTQEDIKKEVPHFLQWDMRWGYDLYGEEMIATSGCGPTCVSMVAVALTGNLEYSPLYVANYADQAGYIENGSTSWLFMSQGTEEFGLAADEVPLDYNSVVNHIKNENPIIASVRPGDFTTVGHFIVIYGVTDSGALLINDPNSVIRTNKVWDWDVVMQQIKNMWAFKKL